MNEDKKHAKERALMKRHKEWKKEKGTGGMRIKRQLSPPKR